jgi:hypothetical protein
MTNLFFTSILYALVLESFRQAGARTYVSKIQESARSIVFFGCVASYQIGSIIMHTSETKRSYFIYVSMTSYFYYFYMSMYPMANITIVTLSYLSMLLFWTIYGISAFLDKVSSFFDTM